MDPLSISLGIAGVLPLVASAIKAARGYRDAIKNRQNSISDLITQLQTLETCLYRLDKFLTSDSPSVQDLRFDDASVLRSCYQACERNLQVLVRKLDREGNSKMSKYIWPLSEKEHEKAVQELRSFTTWMQFALSIEGCSLLSQTSEDVMKLLGHQLEQFDVIRALELQTRELGDAVEAQARLLAQSRAEEEKVKILDWVSTTNHDQKHINTRSSRAENTGLWLLEKPEYREWRDDLRTENTLWLPGIQGSGKTNLVSIVIDDLLSRARQDTTPCAYFYFDYQNQDTQDPGSILRCLLRQLTQPMISIPKSVSDLYDRLGERGDAMPLHECERIIVELAKTSRGLYLVFDALDECDGMLYRKEFLQTMGRLKQEHLLRILVTSRPHLEDVQQAFRDSVQVKIEAHDEDIKAYIRYELRRQGTYELLNHPFSDHLVDVLPQQADGMFLLPVLQLRTILKEPTLGDMEYSLKRISHDLISALEETAERIRSLPRSRRELGMCALMWICHAKRPLEVSELADVLAIRPHLNRANENYRPFTSTILDCCQGFLHVEPVTQIIRPVHYTIQEYLTNNSAKLFPDAEARMACACLKYLLFEDFAAGPWKDSGVIDDYIDSYHFLPYASTYWGVHSRGVEGDPHVQASLGAFFRSPHAGAVSVQIWRYHVKGYRRVYWEPAECLSYRPLHSAARGGLCRTVARLLRDGTCDVNSRTKMGSTALIGAAAENHVELVRIMLDHGADPHIENWYGDAMRCAVEAGSVGAIRELVGRGGMARLDPGILYSTVDKDQGGALEALVDMGVFAEAFTPEFAARLFHHAALQGRVGIVDVLVRRGWADLDARSMHGLTAMHFAAMALDPTVLARLVEAAADRGGSVNAVDDAGKTPWDYAQHFGNESCMRLLESAGARAGDPRVASAEIDAGTTIQPD
ncbi:hypothetical protein F4778DRAFT_323682 [Xylariomycetidae sp. FL2044]|nr:hypothetical protein F4778DRAFT_323682 [Xylariomycetidae sp. FL2044]